MTTMTNTDQAEPARKARRSRARPIVITLVVLLALLVGADFGAAAIAEYQVSKRARTAFALSDDPAVTVNGFPFLTQAISGEYNHITVDAKGVPVRDLLQDVEVHADLRGVQAPLSDLLSGKVDSIQVNQIEGQLRVKAADFNRALQKSKQFGGDITGVTIDPASEKRVQAPAGSEADFEDPKTEQAALEEETEDTTAGMRVGATIDVGGTRTDIVVFAMVELVNGGKIIVKPARIEASNSIAGNISLNNVLKKAFTQTLDPGTLPVAITATSIKVDPGSISLKGKSENVKLRAATG
jgi:hypothetical protein